jgi:hypothetical protein
LKAGALDVGAGLAFVAEDLDEGPVWLFVGDELAAQAFLPAPALHRTQDGVPQVQVRVGGKIFFEDRLRLTRGAKCL